MVRIQPSGDPTTGLVRVSAVDSRTALALPTLSFVLTLEHDPGVTHARGQLRSLLDDVTYPIQSSAAFFETLRRYLAPGLDA